MKIILTEEQYSKLKKDNFKDDLELLSTVLTKTGLVHPEHIDMDNNEIAVYGILNSGLPYFFDNYIRIEADGRHNNIIDGINIEGVDYGEPIDIEERNEVFSYIDENWIDTLNNYFDGIVINFNYDED